MGKGVLSYNKLVFRTRRLVEKYAVPRHWSKTKNERFDVHTICVLFVLFQIEQKDYRLFSAWLAITPALGLPNVPHWTTLQKAFTRLPPKLIRNLVQLSGKCKDKIQALDPTYYQATNPSIGYCKRTGRDPRREKTRKATVVVTKKHKLVADVFVGAKERHGMMYISQIATSGCFKDRTTLADKEFDSEEFHQLIDDEGGKSIVPPKNKKVPVWRTRGEHRKKLKRRLPVIYRFRSSCSESNNSAVKRRFSPVLRGRTFWQQARDLYDKYLAYNLSRDCFSKYLLELSTELKITISIHDSIC